MSKNVLDYEKAYKEQRTIIKGLIEENEKLRKILKENNIIIDEEGEVKENES